MLIIRHAQMEVFRAMDRRDFEQRLAGQLARSFALTVDQAVDIVRHCMLCAARFGLTDESGITTLGELMAQEGVAFFDDPQKPQALQILSNVDLPERARMQLLLRRRPWPALTMLQPVVDSD
ncbi:MAG: hypothetical protein KAY46_05040 [Burkholderiaceae bacterium]|jgi:hypothetical protein|nr:hypothetical protein [Burkholderiaceae bacterium]